MASVEWRDSLGKFAQSRLDMATAGVPMQVVAWNYPCRVAPVLLYIAQMSMSYSVALCHRSSGERLPCCGGYRAMFLDRGRTWHGRAVEPRAWGVRKRHLPHHVAQDTRLHAITLVVRAREDGVVGGPAHDAAVGAHLPQAVRDWMMAVPAEAGSGGMRPHPAASTQR